MMEKHKSIFKLKAISKVKKKSFSSYYNIIKSLTSIHNNKNVSLFTILEGRTPLKKSSDLLIYQSSPKGWFLNINFT